MNVNWGEHQRMSLTWEDGQKRFDASWSTELVTKPLAVRRCFKAEPPLLYTLFVSLSLDLFVPVFPLPPPFEDEPSLPSFLNLFRTSLSCFLFVPSCSSISLVSFPFRSFLLVLVYSCWLVAPHHGTVLSYRMTLQGYATTNRRLGGERRLRGQSRG